MYETEKPFQKMKLSQPHTPNRIPGRLLVDKSKMQVQQSKSQKRVKRSGLLQEHSSSAHQINLLQRGAANLAMKIIEKSKIRKSSVLTIKKSSIAFPISKIFEHQKKRQIVQPSQKQKESDDILSRASSEVDFDAKDKQPRQDTPSKCAVPLQKSNKKRQVMTKNNSFQHLMASGQTKPSDQPEVTDIYDLTLGK